MQRLLAILLALWAAPAQAQFLMTGVSGHGGVAAGGPYVQQGVHLFHSMGVGPALNTPITSTNSCQVTASYWIREAPWNTSGSYPKLVPSGLYTRSFGDFAFSVNAPALFGGQESAQGYAQLVDSVGMRIAHGGWSSYPLNANATITSGGANSITVTGNTTSYPSQNMVRAGDTVIDITQGQKLIGLVSALTPSGGNTIVATVNATGTSSFSALAGDTISFSTNAVPATSPFNSPYTYATMVTNYSSGQWHHHLISINTCNSNGHMQYYVDGTKWSVSAADSYPLAGPYLIGLANPGLATTPGLSFNFPTSATVPGGEVDVADVMMWKDVDLLHCTGSVPSQTCNTTIIAGDLANFSAGPSGVGNWLPKDPAVAIAAYGAPIIEWSRQGATPFQTNSAAGGVSTSVNNTPFAGTTPVDLPYAASGQANNTAMYKWACAGIYTAPTGTAAATIALGAPTVTMSGSPPASYINGMTAYDFTSATYLGPTTWSGTTLTFTSGSGALAAGSGAADGFQFNAPHFSCGNVINTGDALIALQGWKPGTTPTVTPTCLAPIGPAGGGAWTVRSTNYTANGTFGNMAACVSTAIANATDASYSLTGGQYFAQTTVGMVTGLNTNTALIDYGDPTGAVIDVAGTLTNTGSVTSYPAGGVTTTVAGDTVVGVFFSPSANKGPYGCPAALPNRRLDGSYNAQSVSQWVFLVCDGMNFASGATGAQNFTSTTAGVGAVMLIGIKK